MIKYNPKHWFSLIFQFHRSDTFRILFPTMFLVGVYTAILTYLALEVFHWEVPGATVIHSLLGVVLGLILVFRNNTSYERWWEGRKLWGALLNDSRNLALKIHASLPEDQENIRIFFARHIANFAYALKGHLRGKVNPNELEPVTDVFARELAHVRHIPNKIAGEMYVCCNQLYREQVLSGEQLIILDQEIKSLTDITGACERIKNTPIPYAYSLFMKKFIFLYIMTMPLGFIPSFGYWTVAVVVWVFYVLVSIELIAEEIENPFGIDANDLPLDEIALRIRQNVREILLAHETVVKQTG